MIKMNCSWIKYSRYGRCFLLKLIYIILSKYLNLLYLWKKYEKNITYFCIHSQNNGKFMTFIMYSLEFRATKKQIQLEWMHNFVHTWFRIDKKMMRNFVQKNHFLQNRETVPKENLLFCGNLSKHWEFLNYFRHLRLQ